MNVYIFRELLEVSQEDPKLSYKLHGFVSNANYSMKKGTFLLFINRKYYKFPKTMPTLTLVYLCCLLITFAISLDPDQA